MSALQITIGPDGYYHPASEAQLVELVRYAYDQTMQLRVRGSAHSLAPAIYTNGYSGTGTPPGESIDVMLDQYRAVTITPDPTTGEADVVVEAGCNLGKDPYDSTGNSTWGNSLNYLLQKAGYALADTGGITHQTISGFISTGSSGGSLTYSFFDENLVGLDLIDGTGKIHRLRRDDDATRDMFYAAGVSMGLLGVISKVILRVKATYNIYGTQTTTATSATGIDLFGTGERGIPSFKEFLKATPYTRLMWWPQRGVERMSVWQAARLEPTDGFMPQPYLEMGRFPTPEALAGSLFYTVIGNLLFVSSIPGKLQNWFAHFEDFLEGGPDPNACPVEVKITSKKANLADVLDKFRGYLEAGFQAVITEGGRAVDIIKERLPALEALRAARADGPREGVPTDLSALPAWLAQLITHLVEVVITKAVNSEWMLLVAWVLQDIMPWLITPVLRMFITENTQYFWESWRCGLPMDNQMDDQLWNTEFTELWIPLDKWAEVMQALNDFYAAGGDPVKAFANAGAFSCELYAAGKSNFWMSPSYGTDVIRVDVFWFGLNQVPPTTQFYPPFWDLLKPFNYRPHWGKYLGPPENYLSNLPKLADFLSLRETLDPKGIFLTDYWKQALGITAYVPPSREVNLLAATPTGPGAITSGTNIKLGMLTLDGTDIILGDGVMTELTEGKLIASGTYNFEWKGTQYSGTWSTQIVRVPLSGGYVFTLSEQFTGTIEMVVGFTSEALQMGSGESTTIAFTQTTFIKGNFPVINIQTFRNEAPGQQARIMIAGPVPVFLYGSTYYVNASYFETP